MMHDSSSGDDDSSSGDDDSSSGDDDSSSVCGLIRRRPAGQPAKVYIFCGTGLGRHFEDRSPRGTGPLLPARRLTRCGTGRNGMGKPV
ncbi:hypothetical protein YC2023_091039 [Brassica napus]